MPDEPNEEQMAREELKFELGERAAWLQCMVNAVRHLDMIEPGTDKEMRKAAALLIEREETIKVLRQLCAEYGDNTWESTLYTADIIDKSLGRPIAQIVREKDRAETWLKKAHEVADGFLGKVSDTHIVDKICAIGWERDRLRQEVSELKQQLDLLNSTKERTIERQSNLHITISGIVGSGKSTLAVLISDYLSKEHGMDVDLHDDDIYPPQLQILRHAIKERCCTIVT